MLKGIVGHNGSLVKAYEAVYSASKPEVPYGRGWDTAPAPGK